MDASLPEVRLQQQPTERERLLPWRYALVGVGALHTLLCAGVVFGWSSLEAVLRDEGKFGPAPDELFAFVFTLGAVGNYVSNLPFGALLDAKGPRFVGAGAGADAFSFNKNYRLCWWADAMYVEGYLCAVFAMAN